SESAGQLGCTSCHNPHKKVAKAQRPAFYRAKCLECHQLTDCAEPSMGHTTDPAQSDCVSCHMVKTRPADVVHATVTDHYIRRRRPNPDPAAARAEQPDRPAPASVEPLFEGTAKTSQWKVMAGLATAGSASTQDLREWQQAFEASKPHNATAYVQIGAALGRRDRTAAIRLLREGVAEHPKVAEVHWELGDSLWMTGNATQAVHHLSIADQLSGQRHPDIAKSLGIACALAGSLPRAVQALQRSLRMRPNDRSTWLQLANTLIELQDLPAAAQAFERAIELVPDHVDAYRGLSGIYGQLGRQEDALRVLRQGASILLEIRLDLVALHCLSKRPEHRNPAEGLRLAEAAVRTNPQNPRSLLHRALASSLTQPARPALAAITQAASAGADPACCDALRVLVYRASGDVKQASHYLDQFGKGLGTAHREPLRKQLAGFLQSLSNPKQRKR
ncbi:MAG: tetratricopeptide repeat protein, partial [Nevskia sp.]|nr:tetratricopeptide repeat protein [Nevskia sp.]